ncbi:hypothetical protein [Pseudomonas sp. MWU12-2345]|uniref:hypothetical protein n=1 Tax=Pseudomonas sp. MWU12-2345 TaxID=2928689 RepID=UPI00200C7111|nr:hypothetical protein [Pseudomonas sp. MWU12-2345]
MSPQPNPDRVSKMKYSLSVTPRAWDKAVQSNQYRCGSTYESRLLDLLHAVSKAHHRQPDARQIHFGLYQRLHTGRRTKQSSLELTLKLVETDPETPYLLLSLKDERVDS